MTFKCSVCEKSYSRKRHLRLHFARKHSDKSNWTHKCEICDKVYADLEILERHKKTHFVQVVCPNNECDAKFSSVSAMHKHRRNFHCEQKECEKQAKEYKCSKCEASFAKHHLLSQHMYLHTGVLPFKCSHCEKAFSTLSHRNRHEKVHDGYTCSQCQENFATWSKLRAHVSTFHRRIYKCSDCAKEFTLACRLKEHLLIHQTERPVFKCKECERTFVKKSNLKTHVKTYHLKEKNFKCEFEGCGKSFAFKHTLKKHLNVHEPDYVAKRKPSFGRKKISLISRITGINPDYPKVEVTVEA